MGGREGACQCQTALRSDTRLCTATRPPRCLLAFLPHTKKLLIVFLHMAQLSAIPPLVCVTRPWLCRSTRRARCSRPRRLFPAHRITLAAVLGSAHTGLRHTVAPLPWHCGRGSWG